MLRNNPSVSRHGGSSRNFHLHGEGSQKEIYQAFLTLYNKLANNPEILRDMLSDLHVLQDKVYFSNPDNLELNRQIAELVRQNHSLARLQTKGCIDSALYIEKCNLNNQKIEALRKKLKHDQALNYLARSTNNFGNPQKVTLYSYCKAFHTNVWKRS